MRPGASSQAGRLLALLELGGWWSTQDLLKEVPSIVHSRVSDLRAKGYDIQHRTTGEGAAGSQYRLIGFDRGLASTAGLPTVRPAVDGGPASSAAPSPGSEGAQAAVAPSQLALGLSGRLHEDAA